MKPGKELHTARDPRVRHPCARWYSDLLVSVMTLVRVGLRYLISVQTNNPRQGRSHWGCRVATLSQYLACQHIRWISIVFVNAAMLTKLKESPICRQIGLERNLFVGKLDSNEIYLSANWVRTKYVCRKLGSNEICLSANWARTKFVCRQIGLERNLFVGKLDSNEICLSAN